LFNFCAGHLRENKTVDNKCGNVALRLRDTPAVNFIAGEIGAQHCQEGQDGQAGQVDQDQAQEDQEIPKKWGGSLTSWALGATSSRVPDSQPSRLPSFLPEQETERFAQRHIVDAAIRDLPDVV